MRSPFLTRTDTPTFAFSFCGSCIVDSFLYRLLDQIPTRVYTNRKDKKTHGREESVAAHLIIFSCAIRWAISLGRQLPGRTLLLEEFFAGLLFGYDICYLIRHSTPFTATAVPIRTVAAIQYFARTSAHLRRPYDAALFQQVNEASSARIANAQTAL